MAASLYANAVYQPRNESALEQALDRELQAVVSGEADMQVVGDGFVVVERPVVSEVKTDKLIAEIAQLEAEMTASSETAAQQLSAAYEAGKVETVAQRQPATDSDDSTATGPTTQQIARAAQVIQRISGIPVGQTIGTLASIISNPFVSAAIIEIAEASTQPGGIAAVASNSGGLSAPAQTLVAQAGAEAAASSIAESVTQSATTTTGSTTVSGSGATPTSP